MDMLKYEWMAQKGLSAGKAVMNDYSKVTEHKSLQTYPMLDTPGL